MIVHFLWAGLAFWAEVEYKPGCGASPPSFSSGGEPAEPSEITVKRVYKAHGDEPECTFLLQSDYGDAIEEAIGIAADELYEQERRSGREG